MANKTVTSHHDGKKKTKISYGRLDNTKSFLISLSPEQNDSNSYSTYGMVYEMLIKQVDSNIIHLGNHI
jgi:hypothetical protein